MFNEQSLREAIIEKWGPAGAHIEVFNHIMSLVPNPERSYLLMAENEDGTTTTTTHFVMNGEVIMHVEQLVAMSLFELMGTVVESDAGEALLDLSQSQIMEGVVVNIPQDTEGV